jgi:hypothetical protein
MEQSASGHLKIRDLAAPGNPVHASESGDRGAAGADGDCGGAPDDERTDWSP